MPLGPRVRPTLSCSDDCPSETNSGLGTSETHKIFSATQVFFRAASSPSNRRALSVDPGISHYTNESDHYQSPPPLPPPPPPFLERERALTAPAPVHVADETRQRGRRVRRRSSADHLVFQRDPVAHHNRPPASSPLSFPPTTEEDGATHFCLSPTSSSSSSVETPASARTRSPPLLHAPPLSLKQFLTVTQPHRVLEHSHTASLGESPTLSRSSSRRGSNTPTSPGAETSTGKSHRSHPSLSFGSIFGFGRGSQPDSPVHDESRSESPQPTGRDCGREKNSTKRHSFFSHHALGRVSLEEEHKEVGDGWQEFRKGLWLIPSL
jgi:hypothetical protein